MTSVLPAHRGHRKNSDGKNSAALSYSRQAARHGNQATCQMRAAKLAGGEGGQVEILYKFKFKVSVYRQTICDMEKL